jgi:NAD(P)H-quinone oxidoreductase subunit 5
MLDSIASGAAIAGMAVPAVYAVVAVSAGRTRAPAAAWQGALSGTSLAVVLALLLALSVSSLGQVTVLGPGGLPWLRVDAVTVTMLLLVTFVGAIITRYSRRYLDGDADQVGYVRWLMATLCAVSVLIATNSLLVLAVAWIGTSLALHKLLTHFADRPQAVIAAHKKFLVSRLADALLLVGVACVGYSFGTLQLDELAAALRAPLPDSPWPAVAAVLFALTAIIKCAQLPWHGWLIQVMEAPTPVSALLHAGVVNIGGFVMIRLAGLMTQVELAQLLLVIAGTVTVVLASLVMITRVSVKVNLAWSTCAQMGFMLVQCGLGAYSLALLHIVAHSLYKAYAFLGSGSVVDGWRVKALSPAVPAPGIRQVFLGTAMGIAVVVVVGAAMETALGAQAGTGPALWLFLGVLGFSLLPFTATAFRSAGAFLGALATVTALVAVYCLWHALFIKLLPSVDAAPSTLRLGVAAAGFIGLFGLAAALARSPAGPLARALHPHLFAGFYIDDIFTRLTFRLWPARSIPSRTNRAMKRAFNEGC